MYQFDPFTRTVKPKPCQENSNPSSVNIEVIKESVVSSFLFCLNDTDSDNPVMEALTDECGFITKEIEVQS